MRTSTPPSTPNALGLSVSINDDLIGSLSHSLEAPPDEFCAWRTALTPHYAVGERLGVGSYGVVASAVTLTVAAGLPVNSRVAIKRIMGASADNLLGAKRTLRELCLLRRLRHDNCISILDLLRSRDEDAAVYLVTQIMDTDLAQVIDSDQVKSVWALCGSAISRGATAADGRPRHVHHVFGPQSSALPALVRCSASRSQAGQHFHQPGLPRACGRPGHGATAARQWRR